MKVFRPLDRVFKSLAMLLERGVSFIHMLLSGNWRGGWNGGKFNVMKPGDSLQLTSFCPLICALFPFILCCCRYFSWFMLILSKASILCCFIFSITTDGGRLMASNTDVVVEFVDVTEFLFCCWSGVSGSGRCCGPMMRFNEPVIRSRSDKAGLGGQTGRRGGSSGNCKQGNNRY